MSAFESYLLLAATIVAVISILSFFIGWNSRNARLRREEADRQARARMEAYRAERQRTAERLPARSTFAQRLFESRDSRVSPPPSAPAPISLSKTPVASSSSKRTPPRKRSGGGRGRRSGSSSSSSYGGYDASSCSSSGGSSCGGGGSSCGGGGGD